MDPWCSGCLSDRPVVSGRSNLLIWEDRTPPKILPVMRVCVTRGVGKIVAKIGPVDVPSRVGYAHRREPPRPGTLGVAHPTTSRAVGWAVPTDASLRAQGRWA